MLFRSSSRSTTLRTHRLQRPLRHLLLPRRLSPPSSLRALLPRPMVRSLRPSVLCSPSPPLLQLLRVAHPLKLPLRPLPPLNQLNHLNLLLRFRLPAAAAPAAMLLAPAMARSSATVTPNSVCATMARSSGKRLPPAPSASPARSSSASLLTVCGAPTTVCEKSGSLGTKNTTEMTSTYHSSG